MKHARKFLSLAAGTLAAVLFAGGCASTSTAETHEDPATCKAPKPGTITSVNAMCAVVINDPVDPALPTVEWKGQQVGFCCKGCVPRWEKKTPAEKDVALAAAMASK